MITPYKELPEHIKKLDQDFVVRIDAHFQDEYNDPCLQYDTIEVEIDNQKYHFIRFDENEELEFFKIDSFHKITIHYTHPQIVNILDQLNTKPWIRSDKLIFKVNHVSIDCEEKSK